MTRSFSEPPQAVKGISEIDEKTCMQILEKAEVRRYLAKGVTESKVKSFIARVHFDHVNSESKWGALLRIYKEYFCIKRGVLEYYFVFEITPFNPNATKAAKRSKVNRVIREVTKSIKTYSKRKQF